MDTDKFKSRAQNTADPQQGGWPVVGGPVLRDETPETAVETRAPPGTTNRAQFPSDPRQRLHPGRMPAISRGLRSPWRPTPPDPRSKNELHHPGWGGTTPVGICAGELWRNSGRSRVGNLSRARAHFCPIPGSARCCHPIRGGILLLSLSDPAVSAFGLNRRLMAGMPPACKTVAHIFPPIPGSALWHGLLTMSCTRPQVSSPVRACGVPERGDLRSTTGGSAIGAVRRSGDRRATSRTTAPIFPPIPGSAPLTHTSAFRLLPFPPLLHSAF